MMLLFSADKVFNSFFYELCQKVCYILINMPVKNLPNLQTSNPLDTAIKYTWHELLYGRKVYLPHLPVFGHLICVGKLFYRSFPNFQNLRESSPFLLVKALSDINDLINACAVRADSLTYIAWDFVKMVGVEWMYLTTTILTKSYCQ